MSDTDTELSYEEVLEYLDDRRGDEVTVAAFPSFHLADGEEFEAVPAESPPVLLGLSVRAELAGVEAVPISFSEAWLDGRAGTRIALTGFEGGYEDGLVITREWFTGAFLDEHYANLRVFVFANAGADALNPPVGQERDPDERKDVYVHDLVGWGFAFDFDGSPPHQGRWAEDAE